MGITIEVHPVKLNAEIAVGGINVKYLENHISQINY